MTTAELQPTPYLKFTGNVADNWKRFCQQFDIYQQATGISNREEAVKAMTFLNIVGC